MKLKLFLVFDRCAQEGNIIISAQSIEVMRRNAKYLMMSQEKNPLNTDYEDKVIFCIGDLDTQTCKVLPCEPVQVFTALEIREELQMQFAREKERLKRMGLDVPGDQDDKAN